MWKLNFQTITPLHISNGNELGQSFDYIEKNGFVNKFNLMKISKEILELNLFDFKNEYSFNQFRNIIEENKENFSNDVCEYSVECTSRALNQIRSDTAEGRNVIKEFVNSNGKFYVPGSSVKGVFATVLNRDSIGIRDSMAQKFVISDSDFIDSKNFIVDRTYKGRPSVQLICIKPFTEFSLTVKKTGDVSLQTLKAKLKTYYKNQLKKAIENVSEFKDKFNLEAGANLFADLLEEYQRVQREEIKDGEYLINLGFGSGSYFKIFENVNVPKFWNKKDKEYQEAHTTFSFFDGEFLDHIGWCKLKIEEE